MKAKHIKVGLKVKPKKAYAEKYKKPPVSTIESISSGGLITLDNEGGGSYTRDYFCVNYKLADKE